MQASGVGAAVLSLATHVTKATYGATEGALGRSLNSHGILDPEDATIEKEDRAAKKIRQLEATIKDYQHFLGAVAEIEQPSKKGVQGFICPKWVHGLDIPNLFNKHHLLDDLAIVFDPFECEFAAINRVLIHKDDYDEIGLPYYNFPFDIVTIFGDTFEDGRGTNGAKTESEWKYMAKARSKPYKRGEKSAREQIYTYPLVALGKAVILQRLVHRISKLHILKTKPSRWQNEAHEPHHGTRTPKPDHEEADSGKYKTGDSENDIALRCVGLRMLRGVLMKDEMGRLTQSPENIDMVANLALEHIARVQLNESRQGSQAKQQKGLAHEAVQVLTELVASDAKVQGAAHHLLDVAKKHETRVIRDISQRDECPPAIESSIAIELRYAAQRGMVAVVMYLLCESGHQHPAINQRSSAGYTPLSLAAIGGHDEVVEKLLEYPLDVNMKDNYGRTALSLAAGKGHHGTVKRLLNHSPNRVEIDAEDSSGRTPLSWAAAIPRVTDGSVVRELLRSGAHPDFRDKTGRTPLSWAAQFGDREAISTLLRHEVDPDRPDNVNGRTPLWWAAGSGHHLIVESLFKRGAKLDTSDKFGRTPLSWAAANGHGDVVHFLLGDRQVKVNSRDEKHGRTPVSWAAEAGHDAVVVALMDKGANLEIPSFPGGTSLMGRTPLSFAAAQGHLGVVKTLLEAGSRPNIADEFGRTALWYAARNGHGPVVALLLDKGADPSIKDLRGSSALEQGYLMEHIGVVKAMQEQEVRADE